MVTLMVERGVQQNTPTACCCMRTQVCECCVNTRSHLLEVQHEHLCIQGYDTYGPFGLRFCLRTFALDGMEYKVPMSAMPVDC